MVSSTAINLFAAPEAPPPPVVILLSATDILPTAHVALLSQQNIEGQPPALHTEPVQQIRPFPAPQQSSAPLVSRSLTPSRQSLIQSIPCHSPTPVVQVAVNGDLQVPLASRAHTPVSRAHTPAADGPGCQLSVSPGSFQPHARASSAMPLPMLVEEANKVTSIDEEKAEWDDLYIEDIPNVPILHRVRFPPIVKQFKHPKPANSSHTPLPKLMTMWSPDFYGNWKRSVTTAVKFMVQPVCYGSQTEETKAAMRTAALAVQPLDDFENEWPLDRLFFLICKNLMQRVKPKTTHFEEPLEPVAGPSRIRVVQGQGRQS